MEAALRKAIAEDGLTLHYQPQVDLRTGRVAGFEALARWELALAHALAWPGPPAVAPVSGQRPFACLCRGANWVPG